MWKRISLFVALPGVGICWVNAQIKEKEEHEHYVRPEFVPYEHLRIMNKVIKKYSQLTTKVWSPLKELVFSDI